MDANARLMRFELGARQKTHVIRGDRGDATRPREFHGPFGANLLACPARALYLEIKPIAAQRLPTLEATLRLVVAAARETSTDIALRAARQHDEALQHFAGNPAALQHGRTALLPLEVGAGHELCQMPISHQVLTQKDDARGRCTFPRFPNPSIDSNQWLDARGLRFLVELHHG